MLSETSLRDFEVVSKLGEGSFSCVYRVQRIDDKQFYAMKKVKIGQMREKEKENALNEVRILASISHPNIVNYREAFFDDKTQTLCIVMELADAGDIQKKVSQHLANHSFFTEKEIWNAFLQMTRGLKALHDVDILHRDLKCANVFCTSDGKFKLGDLNVSKVAKRGMARTQTGTPYYTSPEVWNDKPYDSKCDIWSLGCVVYEMAALRPPFRASNLKELYTKIHKGLYEQIPPFYSDDLRQIISACLKVNPLQRPTAAELLLNNKVVKNTPTSDLYSQANSQTSKCNLLKTIMVPKNLRSLKQALPASKYESVGDDRKIKRANSANNIRKVEQLPRVITTPKAGERPVDDLKYAFLRRPSNIVKVRQNSEILMEHKQQPSVVQEVRNVNVYGRNNSVDAVRRRFASNNSAIDSGRQKDSYLRQAPKELPKRQVPRESSREKPREIVNNEIQRYPSRDKPRESSKNSRDKYNMEDISNRCREIEQRLREVIEKKKEEKQKEQMNPNVSNDRPGLLNKLNIIERKYVNYSNRPQSRDSQKALPRNESLSHRSNKSIDQPNRSRSYSRQANEQRVPSLIQPKKSIDRINSKEREYDSRKKYAYAVPPRVKY